MIQGICDRAILLSQGHLVMEGEPEAVMDYYNALLAQNSNQGITRSLDSEGKVQTISGSGEVTLQEFSLVNTDNQSVEVVRVGEAVTLRIIAVTHVSVEALVIGYMIKDRLGQVVYGTNTHGLNHELTHLAAGEIIEISFDCHMTVGPGTYSIAIGLHASATHVSGNYEWRDRALIFNVVNHDKEDFIGTAWIPPVLRCSR